MLSALTKLNSAKNVSSKTREKKLENEKNEVRKAYIIFSIRKIERKNDNKAHKNLIRGEQLGR